MSDTTATTNVDPEPVDTSSDDNETPAPFEPSPTLTAATDKANRLIRNVQRASTFSPRLRRRAAQAAMRAMRLTDIERARWEAKS